MAKIHIVFEAIRLGSGAGKEAQHGHLFVEVENEARHSINAGEWSKSGDYDLLTIDLETLNTQLEKKETP